MVVILKVLFTVSLFSFVLGELIRIPVFGTEIKLLDLAVLVLFIFWAAKKTLNKQILNIFYPPMMPFILACAVSLILGSVSLNTNQILFSLLYFLRWVGYAGVFFLIFNFDREFKRKIRLLLVPVGAALVAGGYIQFFFYQSLRNLYYLGWDEHLHRMFSSFLDPNFAGAFFVLYFLLLLDLIFKNLKNKSSLVTYVFISVITLPAIFLTFSRSAVLMFIAGVCFYAVFKKRFLFIGLLVPAVILSFLLLPKSFQTEGTNFFRTASSEARLNSYTEALSIIKENPLFGVGFNAYKYAKEKQGFIESKSSFTSHADISTDNSFLFIIATTGVIGFLAYFYMWYKILKINRSSALILSSAISLFINSFFINSLFYSFFIFWMWVLVATKESK